MIKERIVKICFNFVLMMALVMNLTMDVQAGFGDFNDYGGNDWDSGWDSDYDYDYDYDSGWDSDYDYDYGYDSNDYDDSYGSSGWDSSYGSSYDYNMTYSDEEFFGSAGRFMWIIIIIALYMIIKSRKSGISSGTNYGQPIGTPHTGSQPVSSQSAKGPALPNRTDEISRIIKEKDPLFTAPDFISFGKQVYMDIQDAWMKRNLEPVRGVLHQNLYQQTEKQIRKKIEDGIINYLERISINTGYLTSYRRDARYEYLVMYLAADMIDYQVKEATGEIILGNKTTRWNMYYKMTFMRSVGTMTDAAEGEDGMECPNCGAPLSGTSFGVCEYCGSTVTTGAYDWVLSDFGVVKKDTIDEGIVIND